MSKIKVYVRVRPPLPKEFDTPGCFNCTEMEDVSGNWIQIKKDGEPKRYFARVWGPQSSQEECFRNVGVNTVNDVFEGYYGCIFVYGQTGTGKTFTLGCTVPGLEGIQPRCLQMVFSKIAKESSKYDVVVKCQYVQLYRDSVQDLLNIQKDDLVVRVDDQVGATIEDCTTIEIHSYDEACQLIADGDSNRKVANTKMNSGSSRSHACLITEVYRTNKETGELKKGRLYLIDLAGSERVSKSGVTGDQYKEAVAINKSLTTLGNCIAGLVNGEKVVAFRDSKLTRLLQHSLSGHGRTSIIITIRPDSPNMQETLCTIKFGERAQKVEAQMTPAGYRDQQIEALEKTVELEKQMADNQTAGHVMKMYADRLMERVREREAELKELEVSSAAKVSSLKSEAEETKKSLKTMWETEKAKLDAASNEKNSSLREQNKELLAEIDEKVAEAEKKAKEKNVAALKPLEDQLEKTHRDIKKASEQTAGATFDEQGLASKVAVDLARILGEKKIVQRKLQGCKKSRYSGYVEMAQINGKMQEIKSLRDILLRKRDYLKDQIEDWDEDGIADGRKAFKKEKKQEEDFRTFVAENRGWETPESTDSDDSDNDSSPPPSSEPPPSSDDDSSDATTDSSSSSGSDDFASSDEDGEEDEENAEAVEIDWGGGGSSAPKKKKKKGLELPPRAHLDHALKRNKQLADLIEQIADYLEYGCPCYVLNTKTPPLSIHKRHLFLSKGRKLLCVAEYKDNTGNPDRSTSREIMPISEIANVTLGQFSEGFNKALENAPVVPHGTVMPETSAKVSVNSLPVFFYRSLTVNSKDKPIVDIVLDTDTDYEAWLVTLHRLTNKEPKWGGLLELTNMRDIHKLSEEEAAFCQECHVLPSCMLNTKEQVLSKQKKVFYTLFDMRHVSSLDLLHAQRLFEFLIKQAYFERVSVNHVRFLEMQNEIAEEAVQKEAIRQLRLRIVNMHRKYNSTASEQALHSLLKSCAGNEKETLEQMIQKHGPEPSSEEVAKMEGGVAVAETALTDYTTGKSGPPSAPNAGQIKSEKPPPGAGAGGDAMPTTSAAASSPNGGSSAAAKSTSKDEKSSVRSSSPPKTPTEPAAATTTTAPATKHADPSAALPSEADGGAPP